MRANEDSFGDAHNNPILVPGTVVQFGGVDATFAVQCPSVDFRPTPSTPVEVKIVRSLVNDEWSQVIVDPFSFAAQAITALKSENVLSHSWAQHFYDEQRKRCRPIGASHFHGYILVLDTFLFAALKMRDPHKCIDYPPIGFCWQGILECIGHLAGECIQRRSPEMLCANAC